MAHHVDNAKTGTFANFNGAVKDAMMPVRSKQQKIISLSKHAEFRGKPLVLCSIGPWILMAIHVDCSL